MYWLCYGEYRGRRDIKPFMRYAIARLETCEQEQLYYAYTAKSLQLIPQGTYLQKDYTDMLKPQKIDRRSGDEIALDIIKRAGLRLKGGESA